MLNKKEKQLLVGSFLDWVMTEDKTAPLAFSIKILALFQNEIPELQKQLEELLIHSNRTFPKGLYPVLRDVFKNWIHIKLNLLVSLQHKYVKHAAYRIKCHLTNRWPLPV